MIIVVCDIGVFRLNTQKHRINYREFARNQWILNSCVERGCTSREWAKWPDSLGNPAEPPRGLIAVSFPPRLSNGSGFWVLGLALRRCSAFCVDLMWRRGSKVYTARFVGDEVKEKLFLGFPFRARCSEPFKFKVHHITWYTYPSHTASPRCHSSLHLPPFIQCVWCFSL